LQQLPTPPLVLDEVDPQILKTLNPADRIAGIQKISTPKPDNESTND
jgi:hypothetical protein